MQVFNGKNANWISVSPWYTLEFGNKLVHCLEFSTRQGFKQLTFWNLQRISFLGGFTWKMILDLATSVRLQNALCSSHWKWASCQWGSPVPWHAYDFHRGLWWRSPHVLAGLARGQWVWEWGSVPLNCAAPVQAAWWRVMARPQGFPPAPLRAQAPLRNQADLTWWARRPVRLIILFVIIISGWDF